MAKESLAVKYRPKTLDNVVEQEAIRAILTAQIQGNTFQHAYLFCGPAGCGKTTVARIFANDVNKAKGNPIEVDAATNTGVDNIREIIDNSKRKPLDCDYKVYIIDECHMLSNGAWNAMLKLLEEPPKTTIFILCTTDPQKIPATIISRAQRYNFSKISNEAIENQLKNIIASENEELNGRQLYECNDSSISYIAKLADGGMRDAITMLDKCMSLTKRLTVENVVKALGTVDYMVQFDLLMHLSTLGAFSAIKIIEQMYDSGKDIKQFMKQFQYFVVDVCKYKLSGSFKYINIPELAEYKQAMDDEDLESDLKVLEFVRQMNESIKWESNPKAIIESGILLFMI